MSIKADKWIRDMSLNKQMISPFTDNQIKRGTISYGLSSYGYDIRVSDEYKIFTNVNNSIVDPKKFDKNSIPEFSIFPALTVCVPETFDTCAETGVKNIKLKNQKDEMVRKIIFLLFFIILTLHII